MRWKERWGLVTSPRVLFYLFVAAMALPNVALCITEQQWSVWARVCNGVLPLPLYAGILAVSPKLGRTVWLLFPMVFLAAFQLVLLELYGGSIIAVDMFLNLVTTNPGEALELLDNLLPAVVGVLSIYIPLLLLAAIQWARRQELDAVFVHEQRKRAAIGWVLAGLCIGGCRVYASDYRIHTDLYPVNVCYNLYLALERAGQTKAYATTSKNFTFHAHATHAPQQPEVYVLVIGETARACNFSLYGYERETNPGLTQTEGLIAFTNVLTQSNTTHKSVPMLLSAVTAANYDSIYQQKGIVTAFKEAGFHTAFFSNQLPNHSFIDFFGEEADEWCFIPSQGMSGAHPSDDKLLDWVQQKLNEGHQKLFLLLHTYGSHFNYRERYPATHAFFKPDHLTDARPENRLYLLNAYDNTIRYTDRFLTTLVKHLKQKAVASVLLYTSDHGEDLFDDERQLFLHASPIPSYYQLHVPFLVWTSSAYRIAYADEVQALQKNREKAVASNASVFPTMLQLAGIVSPYRVDTLSLASSDFRESIRLYLDDHNLPCRLDRMGLDERDLKVLKRRGIAYP